jgi:ribosomal protein S4
MTVTSRLVAAGMTAHVAARYCRYGRVRVDGVTVTDPLALIGPRAVVEISARPRAWQTPKGRSA